MTIKPLNRIARSMGLTLMARTTPPDVLIVGAGITGLLLARALARLSVKVLVVESSAQVFAGATPRNEGWLHHGTYHAISVSDTHTAVSVAERCMYGAQAFKTMVPEALEDHLLPSYAFTADGNPEWIEDRWHQSDVKYRRIDLRQLRRFVPELRDEGLTAGYQVEDRAVNTRIVCAALLNDLRSAGVRVLTGVRLTRMDELKLKVTSGSTVFQVSPKLIVLATGYGTASAAHDLRLGGEIPIRLWKSHLAVTRRLTNAPIFSLDADDPALMNHGATSIVGLNNDAKETPLPDHTPDPESMTHLLSRLKNRFSVPIDNTQIHPIACTKVDIVTAKDQARSLAPAALKLEDRAYALLPGKMTEAPFVVHKSLPRLLEDMDYPWPTSRPKDDIMIKIEQWDDPIWMN